LTGRSGVHPDPQRIRGIPLFAGLEPDDLDEVATWFTVEEAGEGRHLITQGAPGYAFYVVDEGTADVRRDGETIGSLGPGDYFGEAAMMGEDGRRHAEVVVTSPMVFYAMFGTLFRRLEAQLPEVAAKIKVTMQDRMSTS
jgi:CRP-like cAMP-binding protein